MAQVECKVVITEIPVICFIVLVFWKSSRVKIGCLSLGDIFTVHVWIFQFFMLWCRLISMNFLSRDMTVFKSLCIVEQNGPSLAIENAKLKLQSIIPTALLITFILWYYFMALNLSE